MLKILRKWLLGKKNYLIFDNISNYENHMSLESVYHIDALSDGERADDIITQSAENGGKADYELPNRRK